MYFVYFLFLQFFCPLFFSLYIPLLSLPTINLTFSSFFHSSLIASPPHGLDERSQHTDRSLFSLDVDLIWLILHAQHDSWSLLLEWPQLLLLPLPWPSTARCGRIFVDLLPGVRASTQKSFQNWA